MSAELIGPGQPCWGCGEGYGLHADGCPVGEQKNTPRRFRVLLLVGEKHPGGSKALYRYGCYFPLTDLVVGDMDGRGTGEPQNVEWID